MNLQVYRELRDKIKTGDILAFQGSDRISRIIECYSRSELSHVGIAVWMKINEENRLFICESTNLNMVKAFEQGKFKRGCQFIALSQKLENFSGLAYWAKLKIPLTEEETQKILCWLTQKESSNVDYSYFKAIEAGLYNRNKFLQFFINIFDKWFSNRREQFNMRKIFCSELCTAMLQQVERIPLSIAAKLQTPGDVLEFTCLESPISFQTGEKCYL